MVAVAETVVGGEEDDSDLADKDKAVAEEDQATKEKAIEANQTPAPRHLPTVSHAVLRIAASIALHRFNKRGSHPSL